MVHLVLLNNFKFKYFIGVEFPIVNLIPHTSSHVSYNVFESSNNGEQRTFRHAL
jgi:hypothetical protein